LRFHGHTLGQKPWGKNPGCSPTSKGKAFGKKKVPEQPHKTVIAAITADSFLFSVKVLWSRSGSPSQQQQKALAAVG